MYDSCAQWYARTDEQFLNMSVDLGLDLVFVHFFRFGILCFFSGLICLDYLWPPCVADVDIIFLPCGFFLSFFIPLLISAVADWMSTIL